MLIENIEKLHTTSVGITRITRNMGIEKTQVIEYCKKLITLNDTKITTCGKNFYCKNKNIIIVINAINYMIINAYKINCIE